MIKTVSPNERLYLACEPLYPPFLIQLQITGQGMIDPADVQHAVSVASEANPGARFALKGSKWVDSGKSPQIKSDDAFDFRSPIESGCAEVILSKNMITFRVFHGIMDARGVLMWAEDVFRALRKEPLIGATDTKTDHEAVLEHAKPREKPVARYSALGTDQQRWSSLHLNEKIPNLVAKLAEIITTMASEPSKFMVPVDLRPFYPALKTTGNFSNPLFLQAQPGETAAQIQGTLIRKLVNRDQFATSASDRFLLLVPLGLQRKAVSSAQASMEKKGTFLVTATLSHLGRIPLKSFSTTTFQADSIRSLPLDTPFCALTLVVTEHDNGTEISISSRDPDMAEKLQSALSSEMNGPHENLDHTLLELTKSSPGHRVAVSHQSRQLTFSELDRWSSQVAKKLPRATHIAVHMDHSIELVVALLAILKSGAAFVPIDPKLPKERVDYILKDSGAVMVLTDIPPLTDEVTHFTPRETKLAYAIYTSGSTGLPKGVSVTRRNLVNYLLWARKTYGSEHRAALFTSIGFDLTLTSIFLPLISGGEICIYENDPFTGFKRLETEDAVTFLKATPSHLRLIQPMNRVKTLVVGGEQLTRDLARKWACDVFNEYGPTETTIGCVVHKFQPDIDDGPVVPIGKPIANTKLTISNRGELIIEGDVVTDGYLNGVQFDVRYKTGDLVSKNAKGELVYEGRIDRQLKVNGIRIEPAEIETALRSLNGIKDAAVGLNSGRQLVAYYLGEASDVHDQLEKKIAVVPTIIEKKDSFPLSPNGKIDFDSTTRPELLIRPTLSVSESQVRDIVAKILNRPPDEIGIDQPLVNDGVDSLMLVLILDQIALASPKIFEQAQDFAHEPTIQRIASSVEKLQKSGPVIVG